MQLVKEMDEDPIPDIGDTVLTANMAVERQENKTCNWSHYGSVNQNNYENHLPKNEQLNKRSSFRGDRNNRGEDRTFVGAM